MGRLDHFQYLLLMVGCLLITLPLEFVFGARVYRRAAALAIAIVPVVIIFSVWDIVGILRDHWTYSSRFTTGVKLIFGMPIEELVFFIVVPVCGLLTYEAVGQVLRRIRGRSPGRTASASSGGRSVSMAGQPDHDRASQAEGDHDPVRDEHRPHPAAFVVTRANPPPPSRITDALSNRRTVGRLPCVCGCQPIDGRGEGYQAQ